MVFITLGSQKFQFNRLLEAVDELVAEHIIQDLVFAQIGYSDYEPQNFAYKRFLDRDEFFDRMKEADIVITHGGTGAIISAVKEGKKVIAVPRMARYREHVDDHQMQLVERFRNLNLIYACSDCKALGEALDYVKRTEFNHYESNTQTILEHIEKFISSI